ncbi:MAG: GNAT family N-acetyltransferase [Actinomycetota bacterium]
MRHDDLSIRSAQPADYSVIVNIVLEAFSENLLLVSKDFSDSFVTRIEAIHPDQEGCWLIAERCAEPVGAVLLVPGSQDRGYQWPQGWSTIHLLAVLPNRRRGGAGRALLNECIARSAGQGRPFLALHTAPFMHGARRLYERAGFVRAAEHDVQSPPDPTGLAYLLELPA